MFSWLVTNSYINNEQIKICDIEIMTSTYGSYGSFGYRGRYKSIGHNTYTGRISNFCSIPAPIHGTVHKSYFNYSYSKSNFTRLPQAVSKKLIYRWSQKFSYASKMFDLDTNGFISNDF